MDAGRPGISKGYELSGKIQYGFCYGKTYKEAKDKVTRRKAALLAGAPIPVANNRHRFAYFCGEWLRLEKGKVKESTYIKYDPFLNNHILPKLGGCFPLGMSILFGANFSVASVRFFRRVGQTLSGEQNGDPLRRNGPTVRNGRYPVSGKFKNRAVVNNELKKQRPIKLQNAEPAAVLSLLSAPRLCVRLVCDYSSLVNGAIGEHASP